MTWLELWAVLLMAGVTYLTRIGGIFLPVDRLQSPFVQRFLANLPAAVLAALIGPKLLGSSDSAVWLAAVVVAVTVWRSRNTLLGVALGTATCAAVRYFSH
ncbi:MAG TPA: AzlD domain-containing protein [Xanthomonadaceae bacterium]|nr:AzlD domain-containing protein [Xanthomonadaceae bacterium]